MRVEPRRPEQNHLRLQLQLVLEGDFLLSDGPRRILQRLRRLLLKNRKRVSELGRHLHVQLRDQGSVEADPNEHDRDEKDGTFWEGGMQLWPGHLPG